MGRGMWFAMGLALAGAGCGSIHKTEWRAGGEGLSSVKTTAVLPLENLTGMPEAGRVVAEVLTIELAARKIEVVDRARSEASLESVGLIPGATVDRLAAKRLGEILGVDAVIIGSVAEAREAAPGTATPKAAVGVSVRVVDVKSGNWLFAGSYAASAGGDSITDAARKVASEVGKAVGP